MNGVSARVLEKAPPPEPIRLNDSILVSGDFDARISIKDERFGVGDIILAPSLLCRVIGFDQKLGRTEDRGIYTLSQRGDTLRFAVLRGGAYITWTDTSKLCRLQVIVPGPAARICGTTFAVAVDASGRQGVFYLVSGSVRLGTALVSPGDLFFVNAGRPPVRAPPSQAAGAIDAAHLNFHTEAVWKSRSFAGRALRNP